MDVLQAVRRTILEHSLLSRHDTVVVGVSGGPDSLALLHILFRLAPEFEVHLHVAHLNHQLRGVSADADAEFVARVAKGWGLTATVEARPVAEYAARMRVSVEQAARDVRYEFLRRVAQAAGAGRVAVAHTGDDQVETILMHFLRGAGLAGLRGMAYSSDLPGSAPAGESSRPIRLIRPLLDVRRPDIEAYCREVGLVPRVDESNLDTTIYRNRLRHEVIPYLEEINPNLMGVLLNASRSLADDYEFLESETRRVLSEICRQENGALIFDRIRWRALSPALQRMTLRSAVSRQRQDLRNINWTHIEDARHVALEKQAGAEATLPRGLHLFVGYDEFSIGERPPLPDIPVLGEGDTALPLGLAAPLGRGWLVEADRGGETAREPRESTRWQALIDSSRVRGQLVLRSRRPGDRFEPAGLGETKSLQDFMIDEKIPRHIRGLLPLLCDDEGILWVCGYRLSQRALVTDETGETIRVRFTKSEPPAAA